MRSETTIQMVERHVREGEAHIVRQNQIIDELQLAGHSTWNAEDLLRVFNLTMASHLDHLENLRADAAQS